MGPCRSPCLRSREPCGLSDGREAERALARHLLELAHCRWGAAACSGENCCTWLRQPWPLASGWVYGAEQEEGALRASQGRPMQQRDSSGRALSTAAADVGWSRHSLDPPHAGPAEDRGAFSGVPERMQLLLDSARQRRAPSRPEARWLPCRLAGTAADTLSAARLRERVAAALGPSLLCTAGARRAADQQGTAEAFGSSGRWAAARRGTDEHITG